MNKKSVKFSSSSNLCKKTKKPIDLSQCLPTALHERVSAIINIPSLKNDTFEDHLKSEAEKSLDNDDVPIDLWESTQEFELNIEPRIPQRSANDENENWISDYTKMMKKERIVWQTKLFKDNKEIHEKPLFEQTEELIDIAAEHFACWLKDLDEESNINKEFVKQLFSIQVEGDASKALNVYPKEISVIPHEVAKILNLPEVSFEVHIMIYISSNYVHQFPCFSFPYKITSLRLKIKTGNYAIENLKQLHLADFFHQRYAKLNSMKICLMNFIKLIVQKSYVHCKKSLIQFYI